ncbi:hypothetical protein TBLA_0A03600 [Henningerozyma blattae CBS 6284]|uniref:Endosomal/vacuolar adapter protein YPT35 n=1 Tax=Henningerozyma blattae (strain ATCC 34711 / CBS 6284 / DSM 70876 / NBRC 10599 / NRRL Y-10934 / UCD 77-7) TaxID=1071380 RepID=I2GVK7_HENB6|nr:hypothetical protein TBLA_0A03600 [Tetrapisispora blattae CBS 6284]CCH58159.1 hypothetical protein TBLA_0A03600 [Tetrapisispora blattae CBS 6284]
MSQKISIIPPEPITLINNETTNAYDSQYSKTLSTNGLALYKVTVSDCTIVKGSNGGEFAVWKVTVLLTKEDSSSSQEDNNNVLQEMNYRKIQVYRRYSDFELFRKQIIDRLKEQQQVGKVVNLPSLPPKVPWYDLWKYQDINLDKKWLNNRQRGLNHFLNHILLDVEIRRVSKDIIIKFLNR